MLLIEPLLELKQLYKLCRILDLFSFNRTTFGIETQVEINIPSSLVAFNRTTFGIETNSKKLLCKRGNRLLIEPLLELKLLCNYCPILVSELLIEPLLELKRQNHD